MRHVTGLQVTDEDDPPVTQLGTQIVAEVNGGVARHDGTVECRVDIRDEVGDGRVVESRAAADEDRIEESVLERRLLDAYNQHDVACENSGGRRGEVGSQDRRVARLDGLPVPPHPELVDVDRGVEQLELEAYRTEDEHTLGADRRVDRDEVDARFERPVDVRRKLRERRVAAGVRREDHDAPDRRAAHTILDLEIEGHVGDQLARPGQHQVGKDLGRQVELPRAQHAGEAEEIDIGGLEAVLVREGHAFDDLEVGVEGEDELTSLVRHVETAEARVDARLQECSLDVVDQSADREYRIGRTARDDQGVGARNHHRRLDPLAIEAAPELQRHVGRQRSVKRQETLAHQPRDLALRPGLGLDLPEVGRRQESDIATAVDLDLAPGRPGLDLHGAEQENARTREVEGVRGVGHARVDAAVEPNQPAGAQVGANAQLLLCLDADLGRRRVREVVELRADERARLRIADDLDLAAGDQVAEDLGVALRDDLDDAAVGVGRDLARPLHLDAGVEGVRVRGLDGVDIEDIDPVLRRDESARVDRVTKERGHGMELEHAEGARGGDIAAGEVEADLDRVVRARREPEVEGAMDRDRVPIHFRVKLDRDVLKPRVLERGVQVGDEVYERRVVLGRGGLEDSCLAEDLAVAIDEAQRHVGADGEGHEKRRARDPGLGKDLVGLEATTGEAEVRRVRRRGAEREGCIAREDETVLADLDGDPVRELVARGAGHVDAVEDALDVGQEVVEAQVVLRRRAEDRRRCGALDVELDGERDVDRRLERPHDDLVVEALCPAADEDLPARLDRHLAADRPAPVDRLVDEVSVRVKEQTTISAGPDVAHDLDVALAKDAHEPRRHVGRASGGRQSSGGVQNDAQVVSLRGIAALVIRRVRCAAADRHRVAREDPAVDVDLLARGDGGFRVGPRPGDAGRADAATRKDGSVDVDVVRAVDQHVAARGEGRDDSRGLDQDAARHQLPLGVGEVRIRRVIASVDLDTVGDLDQRRRELDALRRLDEEPRVVATDEDASLDQDIALAVRGSATGAAALVLRHPEPQRLALAEREELAGEMDARVGGVALVVVLVRTRGQVEDVARGDRAVDTQLVWCRDDDACGAERVGRALLLDATLPDDARENLAVDVDRLGRLDLDQRVRVGRRHDAGDLHELEEGARVHQDLRAGTRDVALALEHHGLGGRERDLPAVLRRLEEPGDALVDVVEAGGQARRVGLAAAYDVDDDVIVGLQPAIDDQTVADTVDNAVQVAPTVTARCEAEEVARDAGIESAERVVDVLRLDVQAIGVDRQWHRELARMRRAHLDLARHEDLLRVPDHLVAERAVAAAPRVVERVAEEHLLGRVHSVPLADRHQREAVRERREVACRNVRVVGKERTVVVVGGLDSLTREVAAHVLRQEVGVVVRELLDHVRPVLAQRMLRRAAEDEAGRLLRVDRQLTAADHLSDTALEVEVIGPQSDVTVRGLRDERPRLQRQARVDSEEAHVDRPVRAGESARGAGVADVGDVETVGLEDLDLAPVGDALGARDDRRALHRRHEAVRADEGVVVDVVGEQDQVRARAKELGAAVDIENALGNEAQRPPAEVVGAERIGVRRRGDVGAHLDLGRRPSVSRVRRMDADAAVADAVDLGVENDVADGDLPVEVVRVDPVVDLTVVDHPLGRRGDHVEIGVEVARREDGAAEDQLALAGELEFGKSHRILRSERRVSRLLEVDVVRLEVRTHRQRGRHEVEAGGAEGGDAAVRRRDLQPVNLHLAVLRALHRDRVDNRHQVDGVERHLLEVVVEAEGLAAVLDLVVVDLDRLRHVREEEFVEVRVVVKDRQRAGGLLRVRPIELDGDLRAASRVLDLHGPPGHARDVHLVVAGTEDDSRQRRATEPDLAAAGGDLGRGRGDLHDRRRRYAAQVDQR